MQGSSSHCDFFGYDFMTGCDARFVHALQRNFENKIPYAINYVLCGVFFFKF